MTTRLAITSVGIPMVLSKCWPMSKPMASPNPAEKASPALISGLQLHLIQPHYNINWLMIKMLLTNWKQSSVSSVILQVVPFDPPLNLWIKN